MAIERTLAIVKPDAAAKPGATGEILRRVEEAGLNIIALKRLQLSEQVAKGFYAVHKERPFYPGLVKFVTSGPVVAMAWTGVDAISVCRNIIGATNGREADMGTIRGDFGMDMGYNLIHGSDAEETAAFELGLWFPEGLNDWVPLSETWVYE